MGVFVATLSQMAVLFILIALGFVLVKTKIVSGDCAESLSKLENNLFIPALVLSTFLTSFTPDRLFPSAKVFLCGVVFGVVSIALALLFSRIITKDSFKRNIFTYGLAFSNFGFMGYSVISALFPQYFDSYLIFTLPLWIAIYVWGVPSLLMPQDSEMSIKQKLKKLINPMFICMLIGIILGLVNVKLPEFLVSVISTCGDCMSPIAMLLTGIVLATLDLRSTFKDVGIYVVSAIRLLLFPALCLLLVYFLPIDNYIKLCAVCVAAMPLGLNTIVVPKAYGADVSVASGMAVVSHILSCLTIPLILMCFEALISI